MTEYEDEEQQLLKVKENLMRRLNDYDFKDDGTLNDLGYEEYEEYEEKEAPTTLEEENENLTAQTTEQPIEQPSIEDEEDDEYEDEEDDMKKVDDLFRNGYFHDDKENIESDSENDDDDIINMDIKRLPKKSVKINRNDIQLLKEEKKKNKELVKNIILEINSILDDFKYNINLLLQNANIAKRKGIFTEKMITAIINYHNEERARSQDDIEFLIDELPKDVDLSENQYDKIDKVLEKVLNKVNKAIETKR